MPGITGFISADPCEQNNHTLQRMVKCMMHESAYISGTYVSTQLGLFVGWVGHKGSFSDCMPVWNEAKDICVIFTGEDFEDPLEIDMLKARGHECSADKAAYLVHLYEEEGPDFVKGLNGWFSGVVMDSRLGRSFLFNDRYGMGRIYFYESSDRLYFSSEAKSLLEVLPHLRETDMSSLAETFSCGCVLRNRTLFPGISLLPGGSLWTFAERRIAGKKAYFDWSDWESQPLLSGSEYYARLKETFSAILPRYLRGPRIGISLTGGLDGRMIMAWTGRERNSLPCYTFGSAYRDCTDVVIARKVANVCGQSHETIVVGSSFFDEFPALAEKAVFVSDGTMDVTGSAELYVNRIASGIAPIRLTGNYGSEILRGNVAFGPHGFEESLLEPGFARLVQDASTTYENESRGHHLSFIASKQVPWHHYSRLSVEMSQLTPRSPYLDNNLVSLVYQAPPDALATRKPCFRLIADGNEALSLIPTDLGLLYRPTPFITKCRHLYKAFTFKAEYAYDYGMPQWASCVDHILSPLHLDRLFLGRHKFSHFRVWYRDNLFQYLKDVLLDSRTLGRPYLKKRSVEEMVTSHIEGRRNYTWEIHRLLTSELFQRKLIEQR